MKVKIVDFSLKNSHVNPMAIHIKKSHEGLLHKNLGVAQGKPIPAAKMDAAKKNAGPALKKRIVFAENAKKWNHSGAKKPAVKPYTFA